jgi:hypothetical protein
MASLLICQFQASSPPMENDPENDPVMNEEDMVKFLFLGNL